MPQRLNIIFILISISLKPQKVLRSCEKDAAKIHCYGLSSYYSKQELTPSLAFSIVHADVIVQANKRLIVSSSVNHVFSLEPSLKVKVTNRVSSLHRAERFCLVKQYEADRQEAEPNLHASFSVTKAVKAHLYKRYLMGEMKTLISK